MERTRLIPVFAVALLAACTTLEPGPVGTVSAVNPVSGELNTQPALELPQNTEVSTETGVVAGALAIFGHPVAALGLPGEVFSAQQSALLYVIYDPLAPNWSIKEKALGKESYYVSLRAKSFRTGGDGEAIQILKRRAMQLKRERGYEDFRIVDYSEGIESSTPFTHRYSEGTIQLVRAINGVR
ncbi:MAG: hypothetical protein QM739_21090 [Propionivibrio sp.]